MSQHEMIIKAMQKEEDSMSIIPRPLGFGTREDVVKHLKTIGMRIMDDANHIALDPSGVFSIRIEAEIKPSTEFTHVNYHIETRADPRHPPYKDK